MRNDNDDDYAVYEDTEEVASAPAVSDQQIKDFVQANLGNPALIAETAAQYGVSVADLSRATGYDPTVVVDYFRQAEVPPPSIGGLNATKVEEPPPPVIVEPPPPPPPPETVEPPRPPVIVEPPPPPPPPEIVEPPRPPVIVEPPPPPPPPTPEPPRRPDEPPPRPDEPPPKEDPRRPDVPPTKTIYEPPLVDLGDGTFRTPGGNIIDSNGYPVTKPADTTTATTTAATTTATATTPTSTLPTVTDIDGHQYDGTQLLTLAQQIAQNAGSMSGGVFQDSADRVGFDQSEAEKLLGRKATAAEQVLLDMSRFMMQSGVTDLSQLKMKDVTTTGNVNESIDENGNKTYYINYGGDENGSLTKQLTPEEVARIKTEEIMGDGENGPYVRKTIENIVTGKGLYAGDKLLGEGNPVNDPIGYHIGQTYVGKGGTSYELKFDPTTGKSVISSTGFSTSDAGAIMPILMIASNFLMPGVGAALTSTLAEAGLGELASQVVSKALISGVTSGVMAEASGGKFGDGFLKGAVTGGIAAGVAPIISTALPSDLSPAVSTALTKAGTAVVTALATGKDAGTALTNSLISSATAGGLSALSGEAGLSAADAKLLSATLSPVVTQLITKGNVSDNTLLNAVMMAGSTVLANTGSDSVGKTTDVTTSDSTTDTTGGLNLLARNAADTVGTGLAAASTATGLANKLTSLTNTTAGNASTAKANLTGALKTAKPTTTTAKTTTAKTAATPPAALGALNTAKKTMTAQQISALKASKPATQVNVANLTPVKKSTPPQKVDVKTLIPVKTAQLPAGLNTKKMG